MDIALWLIWEVKVKDMADAGHINPTRGDVRRDEGR